MSAGIVVIVAIGLIITVLVACIIKRPWVKSKRPDPLRQPSGTQEIPMTPPPLIAEELPDIIHDVNVVRKFYTTVIYGTAMACESNYPCATNYSIMLVLVQL